MANFVYNNFKHEVGLANRDLSLNPGGSTNAIRVILLMSNTTAGDNGAAGDDALLVSDITLDEYDGTNYPITANRPFLANRSFDKDAANNRSELTADSTTYVNLGVGTRQCVAALLVWQTTAAPNDAVDIPLAYIDTGGFPFDGTGSDITINWDAQGAIQVGGPGNP